MFFIAVPYSRNGLSLSAYRLGLMLASSFQRTVPISNFTVSLSSIGIAKVQHFSLCASFFFDFFSKKLHYVENQTNIFSKKCLFFAR
jgi:hypothetical protein